MRDFATLCSLDIVNVHLISKPEWLFAKNPLGLVPCIQVKNVLSRKRLSFLFFKTKKNQPT